MVKSQKLEFYKPEAKTKPGVYYKNLSRFTKAFIGGSVAFKADGKEDCAVGAGVTLLNASGAKVAETVTDNYGDFKFDGLDENSGKYTVQIAFKNYPQKNIDVQLSKSVSVGLTKLG